MSTPISLTQMTR